MVMIAQLYKYTKNHQILYLKWVNFIVYKLYLSKAVYTYTLFNKFKHYLTCRFSSFLHTQSLEQSHSWKIKYENPQCLQEFGAKAT